MMKKRCLLLVVTLLSWVGFVQADVDPNAILKFKECFDQGPVDENDQYGWSNSGAVPVFNDDGTMTITYTGGYVEVKFFFDGDEIREAGYTGIEVEWYSEKGTCALQVVYVNETDGWIPKTAGPGEKAVLFFDPDYPVQGIFFQSNYGDLAPMNEVITITKATFIKAERPWTTIFPPLIDFEVGQAQPTAVVPGIDGAANPIAYMYDWGWPSGYSGEIKIVTDPTQGQCLEVNSDWGITVFYKINLDPNDEGITFANLEKINFKIKFAEGGFNEDGTPVEEIYKEFYIVVQSEDKGLAGNAPDNVFFGPAVFKTYGGWGDEESYFGKAGGNWMDYSFDMKWFEDGNFNARKANEVCYNPYDEENDVSLPEVCIPYTPDLDAIRGLSKIQLGIGFVSDNTYYIDDIELIFGDVQCTKCCFDGDPTCDPNSVETVEASSVKVFPIPGGLAIEGAEKATIYGIDGTLIATTTGKIALPKGVYIVKADNQVIKAVVK